MSLIHKLRQRLSLHKRGLDGSTVKGITKWGGGTSPTLPHREIAPVLNRSITVSEMNWANGLQDGVLEKIRCGGKVESKFSPLHWPLKGWKKSCTSPQFLIHSKILGVRSNGAMLAMRSQAGKWLSRLPATKESGSLKVSMETSARAWPLITSSTSHPPSHLKRRAIKADPTNWRTDNTCRVEMRRNFPLWNGRRSTLKTLGRGLKEKEKGQIKMEEVAPGMAVLSLK